jgi:hypothetical protein
LVPPGQGEANDAHHGIVIRAGMHIGIHFDREGKLVGSDWQDGKKAAGASSGPVPTGQFHHAAWIVDREAGRARLHVNARLVGTSDLGGQGGLDLGTAPWRIGVANPGQGTWEWWSKGAIDDVRLYERALTESEVTALYRLGG